MHGYTQEISLGTPLCIVPTYVTMPIKSQLITKQEGHYVFECVAINLSIMRRINDVFCCFFFYFYCFLVAYPAWNIPLVTRLRAPVYTTRKRYITSILYAEALANNIKQKFPLKYTQVGKNKAIHSVFHWLISYYKN